VSQRRIRCICALDAAAIAAWPGVRSAIRGDDGRATRIEVVTDAVEPVVRRMLAEDAGLSDLEIQRAGLADAFLELTRNDAEQEAA
jgi:ABC-2 type transport system ATP-binding protein